jgi:DNA-binding transcriptional MerR regulator
MLATMIIAPASDKRRIGPIPYGHIGRQRYRARRDALPAGQSPFDGAWNPVGHAKDLHGNPGQMRLNSVTMRMRELEKASGVGRETIRYYIREGLLPEPDRASRNSASYNSGHVTRLRAIKRLQEERFLPLAVIRSLLDAEDGDRWLAPDAFPMLDALLAARLEAGGTARLTVAQVAEQLGVEARVIAEHAATGMASIDAQGTMSARDASILATIGELADIGFSEELGFTADQMRFYLDFIEWVTTQEMRLFLHGTAGHVGEAQALDMAERGVSVINDLLSQLRTRAILRKLGERRRVANDNG